MNKIYLLPIIIAAAGILPSCLHPIARPIYRPVAPHYHPHTGPQKSVVVVKKPTHKKVVKKTIVKRPGAAHKSTVVKQTAIVRR